MLVAVVVVVVEVVVLVVMVVVVVTCAFTVWVSVQPPVRAPNHGTACLTVCRGPKKSTPTTSAPSHEESIPP